MTLHQFQCDCCGGDFSARLADRKRGWARFCSKSCKAHKQTKRTGIAGPDYRADKRSVKQMESGHYAKSKLRPWQRRAAADDASKAGHLVANPRVIDVEFDEFGFLGRETFFANFSNEEGTDV